MKFIVNSKEMGLSLLAYLRKKIPEQVSTKAIKRGLDAKNCFVNGRLRSFGNYVVEAGDKIEWQAQDTTWVQPVIEKLVLLEDDDIVAINKPVGVLSNESSLGKLLNATTPLYLVHRLDKETSGVILLAKNEAAKNFLEEAFKERKIVKTYLALVLGDFPKNDKDVVVENRLSKRVGSNEKAFWSGKVQTPQSLEAITKFRALQSKKQASLVRCMPKTGRTHQIRVHLSELGFPILGDYHYAPKANFPLRVKRHLLHASMIKFVHPTKGNIIELKAAIPSDFSEAATTLLGSEALKAF